VDSFHTLFEMIGALARRRYQTAEKAFAALGLNHTEARLLSLLKNEGGSATQETLSGLLLIDRSNAGRALKKLELQGYVTRHPDEKDKRTNIVEIADKGVSATIEISKLGKTIAEEFFGDLSASEAAQVVKLLRKTIPTENTEPSSD